MANDPSMPPSEQAATTPTGNSPAMSPDMSGGSAPSGGQGSVMVTMPKEAFDAIHQLVTQLSQGLDQLKQGVEFQAQESSPAGASAPAASPAGAPSPSGESESDEDFLKGLAEEGSKR